METLEEVPTDELGMNDIASVDFSSTAALFFDPYKKNRTMGSMVLIDAVTNATVGAVMLECALEEAAEETAIAPLSEEWPLLLAQVQHHAAIFLALRGRNIPYVSLDDPHITPRGLSSAVRVAHRTGLVAVCTRDAVTEETAQQIEQFLSRRYWLELEAGTNAVETLMLHVERILYANGDEERK